MVGLNWWMKPITYKVAIEFNQYTRKTKFEKFKELMQKIFIRHEEYSKFEIPPGIEDTPISSEAAMIDDDYHSEDIPLKSSRKGIKSPKIMYTDEKL